VRGFPDFLAKIEENPAKISGTGPKYRRKPRNIGYPVQYEPDPKEGRMAGATFSRYLAFDVISGEDVASPGLSTTCPADARIALVTSPADIRFAVGSSPTAVATGPMIAAGGTLPIAVRGGLRFSFLGAATVNVIWCR
jgi:hypothetical protein